MKKYKKIIVIVLFIMAVFIMSHFAIKLFIKFKEPVLICAEENAKKYVYEKYGFKGKVIWSDFCSASDRYYTGRVNVTMWHKNRFFVVTISGKEKTVDGKDDYQSKEIVQVLKSMIDADLNISSLKVEFNFSEKTKWNRYYDGTNIDEFIGSEELPRMYLAISTVGCDVKALDLKSIMETYKCSDIAVYDYISEKKIKKRKEEYIFSSDIDNGFMDNLPYLDEFILMDGEDEYYFSKNMLKECDGVLCFQVFNNDIIFEKSDYGKEYKGNDKKVNPYSITNYKSNEMLYLYYPQKMISAKNVAAKEFFVTYFDQNNEPYYGTGEISVANNEYYLVTFELSAYDFPDIENSDKEIICTVGGKIEHN